jgi:hypothetical protein
MTEERQHHDSQQREREGVTHEFLQDRNARTALSVKRPERLL